MTRTEARVFACCVVPALSIFVLVSAGGGVCAAGELKFADAMDPLGLGDPGYAWHAYHDAIVCADWDADGDVDILVVTSLHEKGPLGAQGRMLVNLLRETGKLAFEDRTEKLIPDDAQKKIIADSHPVFFDVDSDGDLDICVVSDEHPPLTLVNDGGVFRPKGWGFSAQSLTIRDCDGDGDLDVLGNDTGLLYVNEGKGVFKGAKGAGSLCGHMPPDKVLPTPDGIGVDDEVKTKAADKAHVYYAWEKLDFTGDGKDDWALFLSCVYSWKLARFYTTRDGRWQDVTNRTGLPTDATICFLDVTGDGRLDATATSRETGGVFVGDGKGHFTRAEPSDAVKVFRTVIGGCYTVPQVVADLDGDGVLDLVTMEPRAGVGAGVLKGTGGGRFDWVLKTNATSGQAVADLNNDGLLDVVASGPVASKGLHVWLNETKQPGHWLVVRLKGPGRNPFAVNAVVEAYRAGQAGAAAGRLDRREATPDGLPVHLGLGAADTVDLRVTLESGHVTTLRNVKSDRVVEVDASSVEKK